MVDHFATLRNSERKRPLVREVVAQLVVPIVVGFLAFRWAWHATDVSGVVGGASVLSGFLFAVAVFVFQLRLGITADPRVQQKVRLPQLIDELFSNVLWAVLVSFALTALAIVVTSVQVRDKAGILVPLEPWLTAVLIAVALHLLAVVWMCVRRLRAAYREMRR